MQTHLPDRIDPWQFAAAANSVQGTVLLECMPRLTSLLKASSGSVKVAMQAGIDKHNVHFIAGHLEAIVVMTCQRCLGAMQSPLAVKYRLGLVHTEIQAMSLPKEYEPLLVPENGLLVSELVEDELILALPLVPLHSDLRQCEANGFVLPNRTPPAEKTNPFAVLSTLLQDSKLKE